MDPSHSCDDIVSYIKNVFSFQADAYIKCHKFKNERNTYSSFKISVRSDIFDGINKPKFWPKNAFIKEFLIDGFQKTYKFVPLLLKCKRFTFKDERFVLKVSKLFL